MIGVVRNAKLLSDHLTDLLQFLQRGLMANRQRTGQHQLQPLLLGHGQRGPTAPASDRGEDLCVCGRIGKVDTEVV